MWPNTARLPTAIARLDLTNWIPDRANLPARFARFHLCGMARYFLFVPVKGNRLRIALVWALVLVSLFAAWSWLRPYSWTRDPEAGCRIRGVQVRQDHRNYWLDIHLIMNSGQSHDLMKPVGLLLGDSGKELEPADTTLAGTVDTGTSEIWLKFWLNADDLYEPLRLRVNDGFLTVKSNAGLPKLGPSKSEFFPTERW